MPPIFGKRLRHVLSAALAILLVGGIAFAVEPAGIARFELMPGPLELSGKVNPRRFINAVGEKSGLWGFENGQLEGWVYPLKIFHDFHLSFQLEGLPRIYSGRDLASSVRVFPQMVQLQYSAEMFTVTETLFVPRHEPGFVILLDVKAPHAMRIFVHFKPDLNLMWPAGLGGQTYEWDAGNSWVKLTEPTGHFSALIGSPLAVGSTAVGYHPYLSNEHPFEVIELRVTPEEARKSYIPIVTAGGIKGIYDAPSTYHKLLDRLPEYYAQSLQHYEELDRNGPEFITSDSSVNESLRWSRVALDQLKVCNPYLGCSYVSGYGSSGTGTRPMYAWFFDEPTITSWAYLDDGGVADLKQAFRFLEKFQRKDGKMPHEISQSAGLIDWFKGYPYAYIHPDSTLWYLIAMGHFYHFTGDKEFVRESWPSIRKAYDYCLTILDPTDGLLLIPKGEWGSMEIADFKKDAAMAGEWIAALRAVWDLSEFMGDSTLANKSDAQQKRAAQSMEREFWNPQLDYYDYGLYTSGKPVTYLNPAIGYSAWLGSLPTGHAETVLERLSTASFLADWGQRNMSLADPRYKEGSYHIGSAWPFMTAGPMLAQFKYHDTVQAYLTWRAMLNLRHFDARGDMPEVLTGIFYRLLDDAVPHQMFSELTALPGLVDGLLGLDLDVPHRRLHWTPHLPPSWPSVSLRRFPYGQEHLNLELHQAPGVLTASLQSSGTQTIELWFSPALAMGSTVVSVKQEGKPLQFHLEDQGSDVHVLVHTRFSGSTHIDVRYKPGISLEAEWIPLLEGDTSQNLRVLHTAYSNGQLEMTVEGRPERTYRLRAYTTWKLSAIEGAKVSEASGRFKVLELAAPAADRANLDKAGYVRWKVQVSTK